jgi:hypothetical protein
MRAGGVVCRAGLGLAAFPVPERERFVGYLLMGWPRSSKNLAEALQSLVYFCACFAVLNVLAEYVLAR